MRIEAQRFVLDRHGMRHASTEHVLAARYLDLFGTAIDEALAPRVSPRILVLDSTPLKLRAYGAEEVRADWNTQERGGFILVAMGMDHPGERPMPWRIGIAGDETTRSWREFLDEFDGDPPDWVVADGDKAIAFAVARRWPTATFHNCEWHLGRLIRKAAKRDGIATDQGPHTTLFERAQWSEAAGTRSAPSRAHAVPGRWTPGARATTRSSGSRSPRSPPSRATRAATRRPRPCWNGSTTISTGAAGSACATPPGSNSCSR